MAIGQLSQTSLCKSIFESIAYNRSCDNNWKAAIGCISAAAVTFYRQ
jgi:hypothetical protein